MLHQKVGTGEADERVYGGNCKNPPETYRTHTGSGQCLGGRRGDRTDRFRVGDLLRLDPLPQQPGVTHGIISVEQERSCHCVQRAEPEDLLGHKESSPLLSPSASSAHLLSGPSPPEAAQIQADRRPVQMSPKREAVSATPNKDHLPVRQEDTAVVV